MRIQIADRTYLPLSERPDPASPTTKAVPFMAFVEDEFFLPWTEAQRHAEHKTGSK